MKTALISIAALGLVSTAANGRPIVVTSQPSPTAHVSFADLNLDSQEGRAELEQRIRAASETLCIAGGDRTLTAALGGRSCYKAAVADGLRQMDKIVGQHVASGSGR
jgi:UrcA family protein